MGVKMPMNKDVWRLSTVFSILSNEKYKGNVLL
ncbi:MAG: recombinase family protein [Bacilli bacterium]|nr:recombinase family protein [Bacilli bacterium]